MKSFCMNSRLLLGMHRSEFFSRDTDAWDLARTKHQSDTTGYLINYMLHCMEETGIILLCVQLDFNVIFLTL